MKKKAKKTPKIRKKWVINPKTRIKKSKKVYNRKKIKKELKETIKEVKK